MVSTARRHTGAGVAHAPRLVACARHRSPTRTGPCTFNAVGLLPSGRGDARAAPTTSCVWRSLPDLTLPAGSTSCATSLDSRRANHAPRTAPPARRGCRRRCLCPSPTTTTYRGASDCASSCLASARRRLHSGRASSAAGRTSLTAAAVPKLPTPTPVTHCASYSPRHILKCRHSREQRGFHQRTARPVLVSLAAARAAVGGTDQARCPLCRNRQRIALRGHGSLLGA